MLWDRQRHLHTWAQTGKRSDTDTGGLFKLLFHRPDIIFDLVSADLLQFDSILFCIIMPFFCGEVFVHRNPNQNH